MSSESRHPAVAEERAELAALREQAAQARREAAQTLTALADKLAARDPRAWARNVAASSGVTRRRAALSFAVRSRGVLIGGSVTIVLTAVLIAYRRSQP